MVIQQARVTTTMVNVPRETGVGMVELLVTLFILSIGLLGVASLQFIGSFSNSDALNRSQSVMVAQQMAERLRASSIMSQAADGMVVDNSYFDDQLYNFNNLTCAGGGTPFTCHCINHPPTIPNCRVQDCSSADFASYDAYELSCAAASANPDVQLELQCNDNNNADGNTCSAGSRHQVILKWPIENWKNIERVLNPVCNPDTGDQFDCVVVDVIL